jgi:carboxymethylenebutenolidase
MGRTLTLTAEDGHSLGAYEAEAPGATTGVVVVQEIFGVNAHIRAVTDRFAAAGYTAIAPALFDRFDPGFESGYSEAEIAHARSFIARLDWDDVMRDTQAAVRHLHDTGLTAAVVGFCLGGSVAFLAATRLDGVAAAVGYYGGHVVNVRDEVPRCPTLLHFGRTDHTIPMSDVEAIRAARPEVEIHVHEAGHGFNCDARGSYAPESAARAWDRSLAFLAAAS